MDDDATFSERDLLHFVALRDPQRPSKPVPHIRTSETPRTFVPTPVRGRTGLLSRALRGRTLTVADSPTPQEIVPPVITHLAEASPWVQAVDQYLRSTKEFSASDIVELILRKWNEDNFRDQKQKLSEVLGHELFISERKLVTQSLLSATYGTNFPLSARPDLVRMMHVYAVIDAIVSDSRANHSKIAAAQRALVLVPVIELRHDTPRISQLEDDQLPSPADLLQEIARLESAAEELSALLTKTLPSTNVVSGWDEALDVAPWVLRGGHVVTSETRKTLREITTLPHPSIPDAVQALRERAQETYQRAAMMETSSPALQTTALMRQLARIHPLRATFEGPPIVTSGGAVLSAPPRIGDLEVVTTKLLYYKRSDIAHIENLMPGETKERMHKVIDIVEEMRRSENESVRSVVQRTQSTSLDELGNEVSKLVQEDSGLEAALSTNVHAPYVEVSANVGFSKSSSITDSKASTVNYAHQKIQEASMSVSRLNREIRTLLERTEITDVNKHALTNRSKKNFSGVYCWLDKRQKAQVNNYGRRLLLELLLPEPAVFYRYARSKGAGLQVDVEAPPDLVLPLTGETLSPDKITRTNWLGLGSRFRTAELVPPPPEFTVSLVSFSSQASPGAAASPSADGASPPHFYRDEQRAEIPFGYQAIQWVAVALLGKDAAVRAPDVQRQLLKNVVSAGTTIPNLLDGGVTNVDEGIKRAWDTWVDKLPISQVPEGPSGSIAVGPSFAELKAGATRVGEWTGWGTVQPTAMPEMANRDGGDVIPCALQVSNAHGYAVTVTVLNRIASAYRDWQVSSYKAILERHQRWERDFRAAVSQSEFDLDSSLQGENPKLIEETILDELKHVSKGFLGYPEKVNNGVDHGDPNIDRRPVINVAAGATAGAETLFFETAYDWKHAMYNFYPYMHSSRKDWPAALAESAAVDPLMRRFLRAGAVRVVLPVTVGFERAVCAKLALKLPQPWISEDAVTADREPWISIVDEIRTAQDEGYKRMAVGDSWEFDVATTLVRLEDDPGLFRAK